MKDFYSEYFNFLKSNDISENVLGKALRKEICNKIASILLEEKPKNILEIGTFKGFSLGMFRYFSKESSVISIDIQKHLEAKQISDLFGNCQLIHGGSDQLHQQNIDAKFDLILIDGDHNYAGCKKDWDNVQPHINDKCIILFDDLGHKRGCGRVFYDIDNPQYFKDVITLDDVECMGILKK